MHCAILLQHSEPGWLASCRDAGGGAVRRVFGATGRRSFLSLFDQGLVSGANFFTSVIVGRFAGPAELGLYFLGFTLISLLTTAQISLISVPHTVYTHRPGRDRVIYAGSVLAHQWLLSAVVMVTFAGAGAYLWMFGADQQSAALAAALAVAVPFVLLREFARRYCFAHLRVAHGLVIDLGTAAIQVAALIWLASTNQLTAVSALSMLGLASAVSSLGWLWVARSEFRIVVRDAVRDLRHNFNLAKWVFASECGASLLTLSGPWLAAAMLGTREAGVYAACLTLAQAVNPVLFGAYNVLGPRAAQAFAVGGMQEVRRVVVTVMILVAAALCAWCLLLAAYGATIISALYGDHYPETTATIAMLAAVVMVRSLGIVAVHGLQTVERPQFGLWANLAALAVLLAAAPLWIPQWGVLGAAGSIFAANATGFVIRVGAFSWVYRTPQLDGAPP